MSDVKVASYNVNGLRNDQKRREIFNYIKVHQSDITLLQETHSLPEDETVWNNEWGRKIIFGHGSTFSKGVAILLAKNSQFEITDITQDEEGRYLILDVVLGKFSFILVNVYAPNEDKPEFFTKLFNTIESKENNSMIIAGDFYTTLDPGKDLYNNEGTNHVRKRQILLEFMEKHNLIDIWRIKHPDKQIYTWQKFNSKDLIMSRLDLFLITEDLALRTNDADIKTKYKSDHSRITLNLNLEEYKRGKGIWKFNNLHLKDKVFLQIINNVILQFRWNVKNYDEIDLETQWINLKDRLIETCKKYSINIAKEKNQLIAKFELRLQILDSKIPETNDPQKL